MFTHICMNINHYIKFNMFQHNKFNVMINVHTYMYVCLYLQNLNPLVIRSKLA